MNEQIRVKLKKLQKQRAQEAFFEENEKPDKNQVTEKTFDMSQAKIDKVQTSFKMVLKDILEQLYSHQNNN